MDVSTVVVCISLDHAGFRGLSRIVDPQAESYESLRLFSRARAGGGGTQPVAAAALVPRPRQGLIRRASRGLFQIARSPNLEDVS